MKKMHKGTKMDSKIEKMNRMRKNILWGVLIGTVLAFGLFMFPFINSIFHSTRMVFNPRSIRVVEAALVLWLLTILLFLIRYFLYKKGLQKDLSLRSAVNDERVKLNWLRAFRFAFFVVLGITIFWKWYETSLYPEAWMKKGILPHPPWLIVFGAVISLVGAFLWYNREAGGEK